MRVRKRPIETEAYQVKSDESYPDICGCPDRWGLHIHGPRGLIRVENGDWIITGVNGCKYPIDDETFKKIYEMIE